MKNIIVALDDMTVGEAFDLTDKIKDYIWGVKLNDLIDKEGVDIITEFKNIGINVFADPKLKDIPNTVRNRIKHYEYAGADMVTVMADGGIGMMLTAKQPVRNCKIIGVTVLTSLTEEDCITIYGVGVKGAITRLSSDIKISGLSGIVCSPKDLPIISDPYYNGLIKITPGVRPEWYINNGDDQRRTSTPRFAIENGADYLVIGRPITQAINPVHAARKTYEEINSIK